ncbi:MAG: TonB-dependent receptor plug domain-containing protein, partial [Bacteroidales bacterium]|nr:TonB-dependent receptor plug domain-containing protein [Bacteroidales bacterium]
MKKLFLFMVTLLTTTAMLFAQVRVSGTVTDEDGEGLPGVSIVQVGTTVGTTTDLSGNYTLNVTDANAVLRFTFVGMTTVEQPLNGRSTVNVVLQSESIGLEEVVVTALGIARERKTLTYASQQVSSAEITRARDINFMSSLAGKASGLEIKKAASGAGGSTRTVLRGSKSLSGLSEPLYVIDGVPMVNRTGSQAGMWGGVDEGDGLSQINQEDIESISVLKGSNAAVLYGSQGANGVVIINTKKGKAGTTDISINSGTIFESVLLYPELQYKYGAIGNAKESWSTTPLSNYDDQFVKDFFQGGYNLVNS